MVTAWPRFDIWLIAHATVTTHHISIPRNFRGRSGLDSSILLQSEKFPAAVGVRLNASSFQDISRGRPGLDSSKHFHSEDFPRRSGLDSSTHFHSVKFPRRSGLESSIHLHSVKFPEAVGVGVRIQNQGTFHSTLSKPGQIYTDPQQMTPPIRSCHLYARSTHKVPKSAAQAVFSGA